MKTEFSIMEVSKLLGVSHDMVLRWIQEGKVKGKKLNPFIDRNSPYRIPAAEVDRVKKLFAERTT